MKEIRRAEPYFCCKNRVSRGREKFPTGNLFVTESLTLRIDKILHFLIFRKGFQWADMYALYY